ncbi:RNA-binding protein [Opitutaceae bacterium EW11]|nr:RNA-binding protein [Opitutaceae bacterium EW11]
MKPLFHAAALFAAAASAFGAEALVAHPLRAPTHTASPKRFTELAPAETGITVVNTYDDPKMWNELFREFTLGEVGTGVTIGDYDGDGRPDILVVSKTSPFRLYRQTGELKFEDVTEAARLLVRDGAWNTGATFVDINNDGLLDLYVCRFNSPNLLFVNQGNGTFKESAAAYGLAIKDASVMASFADYDRDGYLDLYLQTNILNYAASFKGRPDYLFHNNGNGTFTDVTAKAGIWGPTQGHSAIWWDFNEDGWPDLYVANDFENPDKLYRNNGDGTFTDVVETQMPHTSYSSMGSDLGDINNDGRVDFFVADMAATNNYKDKTGIEEMGRGLWEGEMARALCPQYPFNALYLNNGTGRFFEIAHLAGLRATNWTWSVRFADLDNDGRLDLYVTNGMIRDFMDADLLDKQNVAATLEQRAAVYKNAPVYAEDNLAYHNLGDLRFAEVGKEWGLDHHGVSFGAAYADLDRDGDLDIVFANYDGPPTVCRNDSAGGHRLLIRLSGTVSNRWGIGSTVRIWTKSGQQVRQLTLTRGLLSSDEPLVHFGLGDVAVVEKLTVQWPSGQEQTFANVAADQFLTITESGEPAKLKAAQKEPEMPAGRTFQDVTKKLGLDFVSVESRYDEFTRQVLLPRRLSGAGPGVSVIPAAEDGKPARIVLPGAVLTQTSSGTWTSAAGPDQAAAGATTPLVFEANGDGIPDLYLASGNVARINGAVDQDRLFYGGADGSFTAAPEGALPPNQDCTGPVVAADFDGDGQLDLFVGGRMVPGKYPEIPHSRLLRNDRGRFTDVTDSLAPGLATVGMVTSALWTDVDNDGKPDLLVATEWGPICYFHNDGGRFSNRTEAAGLAKLTGWWTSLSGADVNGDGQIDYVVGNVGLNTKYHATPEKPMVLFSGNLDGTGKPNLVEAWYEGDNLYPVRGRSKMAYAMPFLRKKYKTFASFATASMQDIFGADRLAGAKRQEACELASGVLINHGGTFTFQSLPTLAQLAPVYGIALEDFDGDGYVDLCLAQNSYGPEPKTGRFDGGCSLLLRGNGHGQFSATWPRESGIVVPGDAKGLATLDWNRDGRPDLLFTQYAGTLVAYENHAASDPKGVFSVALRGPAGNPTCIGGRIAVRFKDGHVETREIHGGSGHLSESAPAAFFGAGAVEIVATWPSGKTLRWRSFPGGPTIVLTEPKS